MHFTVANALIFYHYYRNIPGGICMIDTANNNMNEKIWDNTLTLLESSVSKPMFDTWMKHTELIVYSGEHIIIKVRNDIEKHMLENQHFNIIKNCLESVLNHSVKIKFVTPQEQEKAIEQLFMQQGYTKEDFQTEDYTYNTASQFQNTPIAEPEYTAPANSYDCRWHASDVSCQALLRRK